MANGFNKEERVAFEDILEGFNDALVLSNSVSIYNSDQTTMERTNNTIWRPQPYISRSYSGTDMSSNFGDYTQLSVPATIGFSKSVPWKLTATELRDLLQEKRLGESAYKKLASDVNVSVTNVASSQGTLVVTRSGAASGFDDVAEIDAIMNEQGIPMEDRCLALSTRDYNGMAANLSVASRSFNNPKSVSAYERALVGDVAGFETLKLDYANRIAPAAGGGSITIDTRAQASGQHHTPQATSTAATGEVNNYDNRYQTVTVSATANVAAGDCFTIAGVNAVHHITKADTGQLKTFRVISVVDGTSMVISPLMVQAWLFRRQSSLTKMAHQMTHQLLTRTVKSSRLLLTPRLRSSTMMRQTSIHSGTRMRLSFCRVAMRFLSLLVQKLCAAQQTMALRSLCRSNMTSTPC
jgi:hypothetical protein